MWGGGGGGLLGVVLRAGERKELDVEVIDAEAFEDETRPIDVFVRRIDLFRDFLCGRKKAV